MKSERGALGSPADQHFVQKVRGVESEIRAHMPERFSPRQGAAAQAVGQALQLPGVLVKVGCADAVELVDMLLIIKRLLRGVDELLCGEVLGSSINELRRALDNYSKDRELALLIVMVGRGVEIKLSNGSVIRLSVDEFAAAALPSRT